MNRMKSISVDIDDVVADLTEVWLDRYNKDWADNLTAEKITDWDINGFAKKECGEKIFGYIYLQNIYDDVKPIKGALDGVKELQKMGYRIFYATSSEIEVAGRKYQWLKDNGFNPSLKDYMEVRDKSLIRADFLIDDRYDNVKIFFGTGILYTSPWNKSFTWNNRVKNWSEIIAYFEQEMEVGDVGGRSTVTTVTPMDAKALYYSMQNTAEL